jgi:hypothetical protein
VVPLKDLVENDPINEAAEANAEQDPRRYRPGDRLVGIAICFPGSRSNWVRAGRHVEGEVT